MPEATAAEVRANGGVTFAEIEEAAAERLEQLVEVDPLTVFLITTPLGIPTEVVQLATDQPLSAAPGTYADLAPYFAVLCGATLAASYGAFSPQGVELGGRLAGQQFCLSVVKTLTFAASYILVQATPTLAADAAALLSDTASQSPIIRELAAVMVCAALMIGVILRQEVILFEYIGVSAAARLQAAAAADLEQEPAS